MPPLSRSSRQTVQLIGVALIALVLILVYAANRPAGDGASASATRTSARAASGTSTGTAAGSSAQLDPQTGLSWIAESALPAQARDTLALIRAGGPYPYPRSDDQTFFNNEGLLPKQPRGYYREYTVSTPGSADRGARRIITGSGGEKFYTDDHYDSFRRIKEGT